MHVEGLRRYRWRDKQVLLHEDHRWVLPLVAEAQQQGHLPRPTRVILFDRHTDAAAPGPLTPATTPADVYRACQTELSHHDDDWIMAGIELGLLADVFIYGVDDRMNDLPKQVGDYGIFGRYEMPGSLGPVGVRAREVLDWTSSPILLDIDLDVFAYAYREAVWPWTPAMFAREFGPSLAPFRTYLERAGLVTICREAGCCGGEEHADEIWRHVRHYLFGDELLDITEAT